MPEKIGPKRDYYTGWGYDREKQTVHVEDKVLIIEAYGICIEVCSEEVDSLITALRINKRGDHDG